MTTCLNTGHSWKIIRRTEDKTYKRCTVCGFKAEFKTRYNLSNASISFGSKGIPGYSAPGYNEGLGKFITGKKDFNEQVKRQNVKPTG